MNSTGIAYIADSSNFRIRAMRIDSALVWTVAGDGVSAHADGLGTSAQFSYPADVCISADGRVLYVSDFSRIRRVRLWDMYVDTIAGSGATGAADGVALRATFFLIAHLALDHRAGMLYIADMGNNKVRALDVNAATVTFAGSSQQLSAREFALLEALMRNAGKTFSREQLESKVYGYDDEVASNAIEFLIHGLRKKLSKDSIKNIRGLGWMVEP